MRGHFAIGAVVGLLLALIATTSTNGQAQDPIDMVPLLDEHDGCPPCPPCPEGPPLPAPALDIVQGHAPDRSKINDALRAIEAFEQLEEQSYEAAGEEEQPAEELEPIE